MGDEWEVWWEDGGTQDVLLGVFTSEEEATALVERLHADDDAMLYFGLDLRHITEQRVISEPGPIAKWAVWLEPEWWGAETIAPTGEEKFSKYGQPLNRRDAPPAPCFDAEVYAATKADAIARFESHFGVPFPTHEPPDEASEVA